ncbi:MAG TPA: PP2C family protein-serine/threonine phosphatase [Candidatus Acidoferrum sp.]|nr:PP2C family protein-serine/threonine phosphatase [Candidatus Acidoferrum sp.]
MTTTALPPELHAVEKLREEELEEARAIQGVMLPAESLRAGAVMISHEFQPISAVGGDFLDYFELADESVGLYLGDVSGKGLPAALYAALAVGTLRGVHKTGTSPHDVLATLNRRLMLRGMPRRHTAMQYAVFDPISQELRIASAGMPGPLHLSAAGCRALELTGIPPGLFAATSYETQTARLQPGTRCSFARMGSPMPLPETENNSESSGYKNSVIRIGPSHPPNYLAVFSRLSKTFPVGENSTTTWRRACFSFAVERLSGMCAYKSM